MSKRLAVLISNTGTGTNLQAIIDGTESGLLNAHIAVVISDTADAVGLKRARKHGVEVAMCAKKEELLNLIQTYQVDFVVLAGWKQFITDEFITTFANKILNLHPGLVPSSLDGTVLNPDGTLALWNKGKLTDKAIQNFLDSKSTFAGSSIHFLTHEFDFGPVLGRCFEEIKDTDTVETLYVRLKKKENQLYVGVLNRLCNVG